MTRRSVPSPEIMTGRCCAPLGQTVLAEEDASALASAFAALADPARLRLLSLIANAAQGEACACDLVEPIGKSQPTVSHHLKVLTDAGLIHREKRGVWAWYRANPEKIDQLRNVLA
jgi:ArsR family transcriptional regulator, arsenate/arsenite/antimonite-responsive transcriptional repressor